ncbi:uncharacterized protein YacL [Paenibacillus phyllosphaerae]|uniref:Uncharacterized protein YacL n=1 Tax=Paenibacillus phyllosphaerae TaxID=274593 RepID=A0A7W5B3Q0_9BACL|nr:DUF4190 domain-containing protein [Paenibacillus phyllosphaerae]MBB3113842.1 uncharacterized protein YacL [Paenibacillus phyllosphaerae]
MDSSNSGSSFGPRGGGPGGAHPSQQPVHPYRPHKTNGKSIAGLVLGILAIILPYIGFLIGIFAIIFSSLAMKEIRRTSEQGRGLAIAGLVCGIIGTVLYGLLLAFVVIALVFFSDSMNVEYYNNFNSFS